MREQATFAREIDMPDGDNSISLREYIDLRFNAVDKALSLAATETERRLEALNELRAEVTKDREQFVQKPVYESAIREIQKATTAQSDTLIGHAKDISELSKDLSKLVASQTWLVRVVAGAVILGLVAFGFSRLG